MNVKEEFVTILYVSKPEQLKEPVGLQRWKLVIESTHESKGLRLDWVYTYNPKLTTLGTKVVQFYRDNGNRLCIRVPKKG